MFDFVEQTMMMKTAIVLAASAATGKGETNARRMTYGWDWDKIVDHVVDHYNDQNKPCNKAGEVLPEEKCDGGCCLNDILRQYAKLTEEVLAELAASPDTADLVQEAANIWIRSVQTACGSGSDPDYAKLKEFGTST